MTKCVLVPVVPVVAALALAVGLSALTASPAPAATSHTIGLSLAGITADGQDVLESASVMQMTQNAGSVVAYRTVVKKTVKPVANKPVAKKPVAKKPVAKKPAKKVVKPVPKVPAAPGAGLPTPVGNAADHAFITTNGVGAAHFNACAPVRYRVNWTGAPASFRADLANALVQLHAASGLSFVDAGVSTIVPFTSNSWPQPGSTGQDADLYLGWSNPTVVPQLAGSVVGVGGPWYTVGGTREPQIVGAAVVFDTSDLALIKPGAGAGASMVTLILHELGHAVGLGHATGDAVEVMYPSLGRQPWSQYQVGDLAGLSALDGYGCF